jgi:hypothetical protein
MGFNSGLKGLIDCTYMRGIRTTTRILHTVCLWYDKEEVGPDDELRVAWQQHRGFRCAGRAGYLKTLCQDLVFTALSSLGFLYCKGYMGKAVSTYTVEAYKARSIAPLVLDLGTRWM